MKKFGILVIALATLFVGCAMADTGMNATQETQGISTSTTIDVVGSITSSTDIAWRASDLQTLNAIPPLANPPGAPTAGSSIYESVYSEDTQSVGTGLISYAKEMDVETGNRLRGQWNIEATKQIGFYGIDGATIVSTDYIMVDGAGQTAGAANSVICPFSAALPNIPQFCNRAEAGSTIDMTIANVRTTSTNRFVMASADPGVELNHAIRVIPLADDVPSYGIATAHMDVLVQEGRSLSTAPTNGLYERVEFHESTTARGAITLFDKVMHYESGVVR